MRTPTGIGHSVCNCRGNRAAGILADAPGVVGSGSAPGFQQHGPQLRDVLDAEDLVFAEVWDGYPPLLYLQILRQGVAESLDQSAVNLALMVHRIQHRANVVGGG